jgi:hypothetical protein
MGARIANCPTMGVVAQPPKGVYARDRWIGTDAGATWVDKVGIIADTALAHIDSVWTPTVCSTIRRRSLAVD